MKFLWFVTYVHKKIIYTPTRRKQCKADLHVQRERLSPEAQKWDAIVRTLQRKGVSLIEMLGRQTSEICLKNIDNADLVNK